MTQQTQRRQHSQWHKYE